MHILEDCISKKFDKFADRPGGGGAGNIGRINLLTARKLSDFPMPNTSPLWQISKWLRLSFPYLSIARWYSNTSITKMTRATRIAITVPTIKSSFRVVNGTARGPNFVDVFRTEDVMGEVTRPDVFVSERSGDSDGITAENEIRL